MIWEKWKAMWGNVRRYEVESSYPKLMSYDVKWNEKSNDMWGNEMWGCVIYYWYEMIVEIWLRLMVCEIDWIVNDLDCEMAWLNWNGDWL